MIKIDGLSHRIAGKPILRDVTLTLPRQGITALIGPNGAGKSTLLSLIARLIPVQTGRICVDEMDVGTCDTNALAQRLAILPQVPDAAPRLSVRELASFGRYPHSRGRLSAHDWKIIDDALAAFDLTDLKNRPMDTLSGGQRQKAMLAMILAQQTDYLLLDEPLNNLDIAGARGLMSQMRAIADAKARAVIIVLHDINYALAYADTVVVLAEGQVVRQGPPSSAITADLLHEIYRTDARLISHDGRLLVDVGPG